MKQAFAAKQKIGKLGSQPTCGGAEKYLGSSLSERQLPAVWHDKDAAAENARNPPTLSLVQRIPCQMLTSASRVGERHEYERTRCTLDSTPTGGKDGGSQRLGHHISPHFQRTTRL